MRPQTLQPRSKWRRTRRGSSTPWEAKYCRVFFLQYLMLQMCCCRFKSSGLLLNGFLMLALALDSLGWPRAECQGVWLPLWLPYACSPAQGRQVSGMSLCHFKWHMCGNPLVEACVPSHVWSPQGTCLQGRAGWCFLGSIEGIPKRSEMPWEAKTGGGVIAREGQPPVHNIPAHHIVKIIHIFFAKAQSLIHLIHFHHKILTANHITTLFILHKS